MVVALGDVADGCKVIGVPMAVEAVAMTLPSAALISWAPSLTDARVTGASGVIDGAGGGVGAVPKEMRMSAAASAPLAARAAVWSMVTV